MQLTHRQTLVAMSGLLLGTLLASLDHTIVASALPTISSELGGLRHISWLMTAYIFAATIATPLYGKLGDLYGRKRMFRMAIVLFLGGSALCGIAGSMTQLIAFRFLQGLGAGGLIVLAQALLAELLSPRERGRYMGYFGGVAAVSSVVGPLLGGFLTDHLSWRWVFYVNLPVGIASLVVATIYVPEGTRRENPRIDYMGVGVLSAAVAAIVLFTTWGGVEHAWTSPVILGLVGAAVGLLAAFLVVERRAAEPLIPLGLFRLRNVAVATSVSFVLGVYMFGTISFLPVFLQYVKGASATNAGLLLLPLTAGLLTGSIVSGRMISRTGRHKRYPVIGCGLATLSAVLLSSMSASTSQNALVFYMVLVGLALGLTMQTVVTTAQNSVDRSELGIATSTVNFFRALGGSVGIAAYGAVFNAGLVNRLGGGVSGAGGSHPSPEALRALPLEEQAHVVGAIADALTTVFLYTVPFALFAFVLTWLVREVPLKTRADYQQEALAEMPAEVQDLRETREPVSVH